jgi:hypothetical protein
MRIKPGYEGIVVSLSMAAVAAVVGVGLKLLIG